MLGPPQNLGFSLDLMEFSSDLDPYLDLYAFYMDV